MTGQPAWSRENRTPTDPQRIAFIAEFEERVSREDEEDAHAERERQRLGLPEVSHTIRTFCGFANSSSLARGG